MRERLQKLISSAGICSRRAAEELILSGRVTVNGREAQLGDSADPVTDTVCVDGRRLTDDNRKVYIMLNKPKGYVTTLSDEKGRPCVSELVKDVGVRLYPVGRLDMYSEGLLLMTNDGELANRLMHPSGEVRKTYRAWIQGSVSPSALETLGSALNIDGYIIKPAEVSVAERHDAYTVLEISIHEGRNRQIRKMCELAGLKLSRLMRISEGSLRLGDLKPGKWRTLSEEELHKLLM